MKYYASDIIKKARIAADLVNSDFITWYEEVSLLNDSYKELYQHLIDLNDPSFVKFINTTAKDVVLPKDFHQLRAVTLIRNGYSTPILRRSFSEGYNSLSYEIVGDHLYFNTPFAQIVPGGTYHIEYYCEPETLLFPPEKKELAYNPYYMSILCSSNKYYTYRHSNIENQPITIVDKNTNSELSTYSNLSGNLVDFVMTDQFVYARDSVTNEKYIFPVDNSNGTVDKSVSTKNVLILENGEMCWIDIQTGILTNALYTNSYEIGKIENIEFETSPDAIYLANEDLSDIWIVTGSNVKHFNEEIKINGSSISNLKQPVYKNGTLYGLKGKTILEINNEVNIKFNPSIITLGNMDEDTGYSYITLSKGNLYEESWVDDTLLDYPNSFFFQVMTYALAIQYKIKQGADSAGLQILYDKYFNNFIKSLPQDVYMPSRINNVYTH